MCDDVERSIRRSFQFSLSNHFLHEISMKFVFVGFKIYVSAVTKTSENWFNKPQVVTEFSGSNLD